MKKNYKEQAKKLLEGSPSFKEVSLKILKSTKGKAKNVALSEIYSLISDIEEAIGVIRGECFALNKTFVDDDLSKDRLTSNEYIRKIQNSTDWAGSKIKDIPHILFK